MPVLPALRNGLEFVRLVLHPDGVSNESDWSDLAGRPEIPVLTSAVTPG